MYEIDLLAFDAPERHPQGLHRIGGVERRADTPADDFLGVGIEYHRQVAEVVMIVVIHYYNIRDVADPQVIGTGRNEVLYKVWIYRKTVCGISCTGLPYLQTDFKSMLIKKPAKAISANGIVTAKLLLVHNPEFGTAYAWVKLTNIPDILKSKIFPRRFC